MGLHSSLVKARRHGSSAAGMKKVCAVLLVVSMTLAWTATPSTTTTTSAGTFFAVSAASDKVESADPEETCVVGADGTQECFPAVPVEETDTDSEDETEAEEVDDEEVEQPLLDENGEPQVAPALEDIDDCTDQNASCAFWATEGECQANPSYMLTQCAYSCQSCDTTATENHGHTRLYGKRQRGQDPATLQKVAEMHRYMTEVVFVNETYAKVKNDCKNREIDCAYWATVGECDLNRAFMVTNCAPACNTCDQLDYEMRCPFDRNAPKAFDKAGDVDRFFERVLTYTKDHPELKPTIFSGPAPFTNATQLGENPDMASLVSLSPNPVIDGPWLITLENVFNEAECEHMIQLGYSGGYERSMDVGKKNFDGTFGSDVNPTRTSTNAWCSEGCYDDPLIVNLTARIADITGIHANNSEYWQLLRYEETQQYNEHHDYIDYQLDRPEGVRILTVFFYLNTPEAGGGTDFPKLNITVQPVRGRVVIWPSTFNSDPDEQDLRTNHAALPVEKGIKYGANAWIHQRDFKTSHHSGCT